MNPEQPYNPLAKKNLGVSVANAMLDREPIRLPMAESFVGVRIYTTYCFGKFSLYEPIAKRNRANRFDWPIYVGKAVPAGARQGGLGLDVDPGTVLFGRIQEHARSIDQAENLRVEDFHCRYLVVDDIWIPLGESLLIEKFSPVWNRCLDGFGNHDPGSGRYRQQQSPWDVLHPGRPWATRCAPNRRSEAELIASVESFLSNHLP